MASEPVSLPGICDMLTKLNENSTLKCSIPKVLLQLLCDGLRTTQLCRQNVFFQLSTTGQNSIQPQF